MFAFGKHGAWGILRAAWLGSCGVTWQNHPLSPDHGSNEGARFLRVGVTSGDRSGVILANRHYKHPVIAKTDAHNFSRTA
jgi:hypothetical protein